MAVQFLRLISVGNLLLFSERAFGIFFLGFLGSWSDGVGFISALWKPERIINPP